MRLALLAAVLACVACGPSADGIASSDDELQAHHERDVLVSATLPLLEVSGLAGHDGHYVAIGDHTTELVTFDLDDAGSPANVVLHESGQKAGKHGSQWEAVEVDGEGNIVVLSEDGDLELFDRTAEVSLGSFVVDYRSVNSFVPGHLDANSRGEGLIVLERGHVLVAIEKNPTAIVEMGPAGDAPLGFAMGDPRPHRFAPRADAFVALKSWSLKDGGTLPDVSDLTVGPDGALWALSQQGRAFVRLGDTLRVDEDSVKVKEVWPLGKGMTYAEGLVFDALARPLLSRDRDEEKKNVYLLSPVKVSPSGL